jgi:hypothetical protein
MGIQTGCLVLIIIYFNSLHVPAIQYLLCARLHSSEVALIQAMYVLCYQSLNRDENSVNGH